MRLILVRHGETALNESNRIQGVNDLPLTAVGKLQAEAAAVALAQDTPFALYSSPLHRAAQTAEVIGKVLSIPVTLMADLSEADAGDLEGLTGDEMRHQFPDFLKRWNSDPANTYMPGGESLAQVQTRAWSTVLKLLTAHPDSSVVAVTHNFTIQTIIGSALHIPIAQCRRFKQSLGNLTRLEISPAGNFLISLNETWHLESQHHVGPCELDG